MPWCSNYRSGGGTMVMAIGVPVAVAMSVAVAALGGESLTQCNVTVVKLGQWG